MIEVGYSRKLVPPIVAAAVATIVFNGFSVVMIAKDQGLPRIELFGAIWPIILTSAVAVLLVMSTLYRSLQDLVRELEAREAAAKHQAFHDALTGLPNRALLADRLKQTLFRCSRSEEKSALLILDLDRFKEVNDTLGHGAGDSLVQQVGSRLQGLLRDSDTVARLGGDEFAVILHAPNSARDVETCCAKIVETMRQPFLLDGRVANVGVSIGAVLLDGSSVCEDDALRRADITMYHAKAAGRDCYRIFSADMDRSVQRRHSIEQRLRTALARGDGLDLHFQPQLDRAGTLNGVEALLRWSDEELGEVSPAEILPVAEECGLIDELGDFVIRRACSAARSWPQLSVAVNLSPRQFRNPAFAPRLIALVAAEGVPCRQIELEITENLLIEHSELCGEALQELRGKGFRVALDDFGTGYSSLSYLRHFRLDRVKLDRSFIEGDDIEQNGAIIRAAVALGAAMKLEVVAEGITSRAQEKVAREAGCHAFQGYLYAPAVPAEEIDAFLRGAAVGRAA